MRIACPACNAAYDVPDAALSGDRVVRCARCGTDWAPVVAVNEERNVGRDAPVLRERPGAEARLPEPEPEPEPEFEASTEPEIMPVIMPVSGPEVMPVPEPEMVPEPRRMAIDEPTLPIAVSTIPAPQARRAAPLLALAWLLSLLAVGGGVAALGIKRDRVMAMWPPSIRAYAALGLAARP